MSKTDAAYMRAYRARKKAEGEHRLDAALRLMDRTEERATKPLLERIADLEAEVRHLKEELAKRRDTGGGILPRAVEKQVFDAIDERFNTRPFTPVPKKRHG